MLLLLGAPRQAGVHVRFNSATTSLPKTLQELGATYTRASTKTVYQNDTLVTLSSGQFGTTYDSVTGLYAYDPEPAATNLATNSAGAAATWTVSNVVDAVTPITGFAASLQFGDNSVTRSAYKTIAVTASATYTVSVFVVMDDGLAPVLGTDFRLSSGATAITTGLVKHIHGSLYRVSGNYTESSTTSRQIGVVKIGAYSPRTFRVIGIQVETGSRATSYIPTTGAAASRAADVLSIPLTSIPGWSESAHTLFTDSRADVSTNNYRTLLATSDGTTSNRSSTYLNTGAGSVPTYLCQSGGVAQASGTRADVDGNRAKIAAKFSNNDFALVANGGAVNTDTLGSMPVGLTTLHVGTRTGTHEWLNGYLFSFRLLPVALSTTSLQSLTT